VEPGYTSRRIHRGDRSKDPKLFCLDWEAPGRKHVFQCPVAPEETCGPLWSYPPGTGKLVGGVTPQGYEVGHLLRIHSIAVPHLGWRNPSHFSGAHGMENCGPVRGELKRITVATDDYGRPTASLFLGDGGCQEVVGLIARGLSVGEPAGAHEDWQ
jgi:hypothetical protein